MPQNRASTSPAGGQRVGCQSSGRWSGRCGVCWGYQYPAATTHTQLSARGVSELPRLTTVLRVPSVHWKLSQANQLSSLLFGKKRSSLSMDCSLGGHLGLQQIPKQLLPCSLPFILSRTPWPLVSHFQKHQKSLVLPASEPFQDFPVSVRLRPAVPLAGPGVWLSQSHLISSLSRTCMFSLKNQYLFFSHLSENVFLFFR